MAAVFVEVSGDVAHVRQEAPLYVNVLKGRDSILMMPTDQGGGIHNGETHAYDLTLSAGSSVVWKPAGAVLSRAARLADAPEGFIEQRIRVSDSRLDFINRPTILCRQSRLVTSTRISVEEAGQVSYVEISGAGRFAMGEHWVFDSLSNHLEVRMNGHLTYLERWDLSDGRYPQSPGGFRNCRLFATAVFCGEGAGVRALSLSDFWRERKTPGLYCESARIADQCWIVKCLDIDGVVLNRTIHENIWRGEMLPDDVGTAVNDHALLKSAR